MSASPEKVPTGSRSGIPGTIFARINCQTKFTPLVSLIFSYEVQK
jgi:hypothetical protein